MTEQQAINETKYRMAAIILDQLLEEGKISKEEWVALKKKLKQKYKPVISCLEELD